MGVRCWVLTALALAWASAFAGQPALAAPQRAATGPLVRDVVWHEPTAAPVPPASATQMQITVPSVQVPPTIDGDLSDPAWAHAGKITGFVKADGSGPPSQQTHAWLCADRENLYIGVECLEEKIGDLVARVTRDGGPLWNDDCVEAFFDPTLQRTSFIHVVINSLGKVYVNKPGVKDWQPAIQCGARVDRAGKRWFVELAIPLSSLGLTSNAFGFDLCRERRAGGDGSNELSCWSPTGGAFGTPDRFGIATLGLSYLAELQLGEGVLGRNSCQVQLRNDGRAPARLLVILGWRQGKQAVLYRQRGPLKLQPGKSEQTALPYEIVNDQTPVALHLTVKDADTGKVYAERDLTQQPQPALRMTLQPSLYYLSDKTGQLRAMVHLGPDLRARLTPVAALFDARGKLLRRQVLPSAKGTLLDATVDLSGLPQGLYRFELVLKAGTSEHAPRVAGAEATLTKLRGPFD